MIFFCELCQAQKRTTGNFANSIKHWSFHEKINSTGIDRRLFVLRGRRTRSSRSGRCKSPLLRHQQLQRHFSMQNGF
jgi:hypothetical protein